MLQQWYRAWRHAELDREERMAVDERFRRQEQVKRVIGDTLLVGAIVMFAWSMMPS